MFFLSLVCFRTCLHFDSHLVVVLRFQCRGARHFLVPFSFQLVHKSTRQAARRSASAYDDEECQTAGSPTVSVRRSLRALASTCLYRSVRMTGRTSSRVMKLASSHRRTLPLKRCHARVQLRNSTSIGPTDPAHRKATICVPSKIDSSVRASSRSSAARSSTPPCSPNLRPRTGDRQ